MISAVEFHERAKQATNAGRHERALALLARARSRTADPDLLALLDGTAAYAHVERGRLDDARALCDGALDSAASESVRGIVYGQRAIVLTRLGFVDAALADFADAVARLRAQPEFLGRALLNRGNLHLDRSQVLAAASDYEAAVMSFRAAGLDTQQAKAEHNLGYARMLTGDLVAALDHMARARERLGGLSGVSRAIGLMDHAEALFLAGLPDEGEAELRAAIATLVRARARRVAAEARYALARHLADTDLAGAAAAASTAARAYRTMGAERPALTAEALALGCRLRLGRPVEGAALVMAEELRRSGLSVGRDLLLLHVYAARLASGNVAGVRGVRLPRPDVLAYRVLAADVAAGRAAALGRPRAALAHLGAALDEAQAVRARVGSLDLATTLSRRTRELSRRGLELAVASGDPELAYTWSERGRAHASRVVPVRPAPDASSVADLAELRHLVLTRSDVERQAELRRRIRESAWAVVGAGRSRAIAGLGEVRAGLASERAALVSHLVVGGRIWAVVVADVAHLVDCGPAAGLSALLGGLAADLDGAASPLSEGLGRAVRSSLAETLAGLSAVCVEPLLDLIGERSLVLTPSAPLHLVPWGLLPGLRGRGVTVARSATAWLTAGPASFGSGGQRHGARGVLAIAGPGLEHASAEARAVAAIAGGTALTDARVGPALAAMSAADIVHIAAHGHHFPANPLFSRIELADGPVFGYDLEALPRQPRLIVLSACDVGMESVRGDDLLGLPTALLHAGVRTVVASVARAGDAAAREFGEALHASLRSGLGPADAVAVAVDAGASGRVAPFVCLGRG